MGKLFADAKKTKKSVGPKGGGSTSGGSECAPFNPVRLLDVRELPEFVGGGPNIQFPHLAEAIGYATARKP